MTDCQPFAVRVVVRRSRKRSPTWDGQRRLRLALANNNRGKWWVATARKTVADIERRFIEGSVGRILYEVVGGILGDHKTLKSDGGRHYLYIQLTRYDSDVRLCLDELGVEIMSSIAFSSIRHY